MSTQILEPCAATPSLKRDSPSPSFTLDERWGKAAFWCWLIGFYLAFMPLYVLGLMGATRRMQHYSDVGWQPLMLVAMVGALFILAGIGCLALQLWVSIRGRAFRRDLTGDPWNGRTLEWSTASPPPPWNFAALPQVQGTDAYWGMKLTAREERARAAGEPSRWQAIHVPKNSAVGVVMAFFTTFGGFALIWHIWWLAIVGAIGVIITALTQAWRVESEVEIPAERIAAFERSRPRGEIA